MNDELRKTQDLIRFECDAIRDMLVDKNRKYGNSAIHPMRVFSKADPMEQINTRLDDKLSRIASAQDDDTEDAEMDMVGYLILKRIAKRLQRNVTRHDDTPPSHEDMYQ